MAAPAASELLMTCAALCRAAHTEDTEPCTLWLVHYVLKLMTMRLALCVLTDDTEPCTLLLVHYVLNLRTLQGTQRTLAEGCGV